MHTMLKSFRKTTAHIIFQLYTDKDELFDDEAGQPKGVDARHMTIEAYEKAGIDQQPGDCSCMIISASVAITE